MTQLPILYSFRRCPYAMRARLALWYSGIALELREVVLRNKPAELIAASPKATVPVLVFASGEVIEQSLDIMLWALTQSDPAQWSIDLPAQLAIIQQHDTEFKPLLDRYKYPERHSEISRSAHQHNAMYWLLENINHRLEQHTYLVDNQQRLSDAAIAPFVRQFAAVDRAWFEQTAPHALQAWLARFTESDLLSNVMEKYPAWQAGAAPCYFGQHTLAL